MLANLLAVALAACAVPVQAENHALVMGVSNYPVQPLRGVATDVQAMRQWARQMDVPVANITVLSDQQLTADGIRRALQALDSRVRPGDRVLVYFSGHGTSYTPASGGACEQALVGHDMQFLPKAEFQRLLQPVVDRSAKAFVFLDTCFSGGVVQGLTASSRTFDAEMAVGKFMASRTGVPADQCAEPVNTSRGLRDFSAEAASGTPNFYFLGSAGPNEVAIDGGAALGGFATSAFISCTQSGSGADTNGDGLVTLEEATACAQRVVDDRIRQGRLRPGFPYTAMTLTTGSGPGAGALPVGFAAAAGADQDGSINSQELLNTLQRGADPRHQVSVKPLKSSFRVHADFLELEVSSSRAGYLTLLSAGSSGKIYRLFPNRLDAKNQIAAGETLRLPRSDWRLRAQGPAGRSRVLAVVSADPHRFDALGIADSTFLAVPGNAAMARKLAQILASTPEQCRTGTQRDFGAEPAVCHDTYGAGATEVVEE